MSTELIINASLPEVRIALMENGEIQDLLIERASEKGIVGNIYKGRVTRVLPGMQAAFVDIGLDKAAFLYVDDVYVHSEVWEEEGESGGGSSSESDGEGEGTEASGTIIQPVEAQTSTPESTSGEQADVAPREEGTPGDVSTSESSNDAQASADEAAWANENDDEDSEDDDESDEPMSMGRDPGDNEGDGREGGGDRPEGTVAPAVSAPESSSGGDAQDASSGANEDAPGEPGQEGAQGEEGGKGAGRRRFRRGRRGGRNRRGGREQAAGSPTSRNPDQQAQGPVQANSGGEELPSSYHEQVSGEDGLDPRASDRSELGSAAAAATSGEIVPSDRPVQGNQQPPEGARVVVESGGNGRRPEFRQQRGRDRRIRPKQSHKPRAQVNIQDLLKEGQEILVQVAKDPIATKGARLTCHISLPGRHLVCMPTIDHVGVSRRIDRDEERRRLREFVDRNRPRGLGFIVRTAAGGRQQSEKRIKQDIDYLSRLWDEIREKAASVSAPSLVYEDLNAVLRAIRDWVTEEVDKIIVDSRYHFNDIQRFVSHFMPSMKQKVDLYHGDIPIFDAYNISTELSRALERKVWLKSGGYIVIDQAEALVAIDVNTGRYVGKKSLEDTILKTNLEAVQEVAYQLRLRNCGGIIIIDLIDMEKEENRLRVYRALDEALKRDRARPSILKISELGLIEMTRKRTRDTMVRTLCESCSFCEGKGYVKGKMTVAYEVLRDIERESVDRDVKKILVQAHPDVIDFLAIDERETLDQLERRYRKQVFLQAVVDYHPEQFEVVAEKSDQKETSDSPQKGQHDEQRSRRHAGGARGGRQAHPRENQRDSRRDRGGRDRDRERSPEQTERQTIVQPVSSPVQASIQPNEQPQVQQDRGADSEGSEDIGNRPPVQIIAPRVTPIENGAPRQELRQEDDMSEEDRLAFLRAQAAQDAALARQTAGGFAGRGGPSGPGGGGGKRPGPGGGRGDRDRDARGGRRGRRGRRGGSGGGGGGGRFQGDRDRGSFSPSQAPRDAQGGGESSDSRDSTSDGGSGGNGDSDQGHSQPPV